MKNISSNVIINTSVGLPFTLSGASRKTLLDNSNYELTVEKVKLKAANKKIAARMATEEDTKKAINVKLKKLKQIEERFHMLRLKAITTRADTIKLAMAVVLYQIKNARCTESLAAAQLKERSSRVEAEALKKVALSSAKHERKVAKELVNRKYALEIRRVKKLLKETLLRIEKEENKQTEMLAETSSKTKIICKPDAPKSLKKWGPSNPFAVFVTESKYSSMKDLALRWKVWPCLFNKKRLQRVKMHLHVLSRSSRKKITFIISQVITSLTVFVQRRKNKSFGGATKNFPNKK